MSAIPETLRNLHLQHLRIRDARTRLEQGPRALKRFQTKVEQQHKALTDHQDGIKHLKVSIRDQEKTLQENTQRIAKYEQQRNTIQSKKEYDALGHEIETTKSANSQLEDAILTAMATLDERVAATPAKEKALADAREEQKKALADWEAQKPDWEKRLADAQAALVVSEAALPPEVREKYHRLVKSFGHEALAEVRENTCLGCQTEQTPMSSQGLRNGHVVFCKSCGRLLYLSG